MALTPDATACVSPGRAVQVDPIKPTLKAPGTKRLKVTHDKLLSSFAFNFNLRRYTPATTTSSTPPASLSWTARGRPLHSYSVFPPANFSFLTWVLSCLVPETNGNYPNLIPRWCGGDAKVRRSLSLNSVSGLVPNRSHSTNQIAPIQNTNTHCTRHTTGAVNLSANHVASYEGDRSPSH